MRGRRGTTRPAHTGSDEQRHHYAPLLRNQKCAIRLATYRHQSDDRSKPRGANHVGRMRLSASTWNKVVWFVQMTHAECDTVRDT